MPPDPAADRQALEQLAHECRRFSPVVGLADSAAPDTLLLDVTDLTPFFGGEDALAESVIRDFARRGLTACVAIADTIGAAWAASHFAGQDREGPSRISHQGVPLLGESQAVHGGSAKHCFCEAVAHCPQSAPCGEKSGLSRKRNSTSPVPHSVLTPRSALVPHSALTPHSALIHHSSFIVHHFSFLAPLPIEALRLPEETVDLLHQLGVYRIGQLELLPRADLASRFGSCLVDRWDQATGRLAEPIRALPLPPQLAVEQSLEYPTARQEALERLLEQLIGRLVRMLACCGQSVVRLRCRLDCQSGGVREISVGLFEATMSARHLSQLVHMQLERLALPSPVSTVHVEAAITANSRRQQEELFSDARQRQRVHSLADLIDRLSSRLGSRSVLRARLSPDAQPERACSYHPLVDPTARRASRGKAASWATEPKLPPRPLRLLCQPAALSAVSIVPDGPPLRFSLEGRSLQVAHTWGPERIETGWWRGRAVARDYYRIEADTGERFWVFRNLQNGQWFLHGKFE